MSRPRHSLLALFDPLAETNLPTTPPRNDSPSAESDKENENPPRTDLTLTTFFNRTYKQPQSHDTIKPLKRRLIDVGDITVENPDPWDDDDEDPESHVPDLLADMEDNENDTLTFRHIAEAATPKWNTSKSSAFKTPSPPVSRAPLSELSFDVDATPLARKPNRRPPHSLRSKLCDVESPQFQLVVRDASPQRPPADEAPKSSNHTSSANLALSTSNPLINSVSSVFIPSASISRSLIRDTVFTPSESVSDEPLSSNASFDYTHLRPNPPSTSSSDRNRSSIDLQSSFQIHFGDDSHFDLLNDKVSFLGMTESKLGSHSYLDEDPSFDLSFGESAPPAIEKVERFPPKLTAEEHRPVISSSEGDCFPEPALTLRLPSQQLLQNPRKFKRCLLCACLVKLSMVRLM